MKQVLLILLAAIFGATVVYPQKTQPQPAQPQSPVQQRPATPFEISEYGRRPTADEIRRLFPFYPAR